MILIDYFREKSYTPLLKSRLGMHNTCYLHKPTAYVRNEDIEKGYKYENDNWIEDDESDGFYVPKDQVKLIEFKKENNNE